MAQATSFREIQVRSSEIQIAKIGVGDLLAALRQGYDDFLARPVSFAAFLMVVYPLFALLLTLALVGDNLLYLLFPMVAGFTVLGPVVAVGFCEISRRREQGLPLDWRSAFDFVHTSAFAPILALSVLMMLLYVAWLAMAEFIFFGLFGTNTPETTAAFIDEILSTRRGAALVMYGCSVGAIFAFTALAVSVIAFPLLLDKPTTSATAVNASFRAVTSNPVAMLTWGLIVAVLLLVGAALFLIGLAIVLPVLGHATWHLYRKVVPA